MLSQHGFLSFWICSLIRSQLVCVVSISISCISDLILTYSRIQKKGISATFQIFSKKKKVPRNQHFFIYYPCFLDINTTHSTCLDILDLMSEPQNHRFICSRKKVDGISAFLERSPKKGREVKTAAQIPVFVLTVESAQPFFFIQ